MVHALQFSCIYNFLVVAFGCICLASLLQLVVHVLEPIVTGSLDLCLAWGVATALTRSALVASLIEVGIYSYSDSLDD